jgi:hypothetical protein
MTNLHAFLIIGLSKIQSENLVMPSAFPSQVWEPPRTRWHGTVQGCVGGRQRKGG